MHRRLPPLATLRAFEAAGRHLSFSKAGEELAVGQSAISHHVRVLEQRLGVPLFVRQVRAVSLTPEGERFLARISEALDTMAQAAEEIMPRARGTVRVKLLASFAVHWLIPRLGDFKRRHPGTDVSLEAGIDLTDTGDADLAIRYGQGDWPGVEVRKLMDETVTPVVSPALMAQGPAIERPSDLAGHELLAAYSRRGSDWEAWLRAADLRPDQMQLKNLHDYGIVLQAALQGQGVAMGRDRLVVDKLAAGLLVQPLPLRIISPFAWWVVMPRRRTSEAAAAFVAWLEATSGPSGSVQPG